jgi:hypothetical protein
MKTFEEWWNKRQIPDALVGLPYEVNAEIKRLCKRAWNNSKEKDKTNGGSS